MLRSFKLTLLKRGIFAVICILINMTRFEGGDWDSTMCERERANDFSHWLVFPELCYCWLFQFAKYECSQAALSNNNINPEGLLTLYSGNTSNFGTPYSPGAVGCACGALDTCATPDLTCNCDARGPLASDQGFITDSSVLPVVGFYRNIRSPSGRGRLSLTSVRCVAFCIQSF